MVTELPVEWKYIWENWKSDLFQTFIFYLEFSCFQNLKIREGLNKENKFDGILNRRHQTQQPPVFGGIF